MPKPQNRNDRRKGEERSETLIIPHITKEMLETARRMAEEGASRAEIEKAISAMQSPAQPASSPASRSAQHAAPAPQPMAAPLERKHRIIPTSRPRLSAEERAALRQQMQMGETQAETPQPEPEQEALRQEAARRAANSPAWFGRRHTKNYSMGEGGALVINNPDYNERAEILREKGTNRAKFFRGQVDKYTWVDFGDSYLPSELNAAYLWAQLLHADEINENRLTSWHRYREAFLPLAEAGKIELQHIPAECTHNAHMFYLKCKNLEERTEFIRFLKENDILAVFHYIPLHSAPAGEKFGRFDGEDVYTTAESERLVRLPMYYSLTEDDQNKVIAKVLEFYEK